MITSSQSPLSLSKARYPTPLLNTSAPEPDNSEICFTYQSQKPPKMVLGISAESDANGESSLQKINKVEKPDCTLYLISPLPSYSNIALHYQRKIVAIKIRVG